MSWRNRKGNPKGSNLILSAHRKKNRGGNLAAWRKRAHYEIRLNPCMLHYNFKSKFVKNVCIM